jgi:DNA-binding response OmpR family regulator
MSEGQARILIVDDEPDVVAVLTAFFSESDRYEIMTAQQGADAVMIANFHRPDAVLLDIAMPGMDGVKVLRAIRAMDSTIPVVMITANADEKIARDTLTIGAFDYVPKPFNFDVLDTIMTAAVAAGAGGEWSAFSGDRSARRPHALTADQVNALVRRESSSLRELLRIAN